MITIVMYHYVRELGSSRYPEIKGLDLSLFHEQMAYIRRHYVVITAEELISAVAEEATNALPTNALLLTFDDGLIDHYEYVFPVLQRFKIQGSFFPPAMPSQERRVLDVHKVHFILAAVADKKMLVLQIFEALDRNRCVWNLQSNQYYYKGLAQASRFDPPEVVFVKRMLQYVLPFQLRNELTDYLFGKFVSKDEDGFAAELYMSIDHLREMTRMGMYIGNHSYSHQWMSQLDKAQQETEIEMGLAFLRVVGSDCNSWIMCYPYGDVNESLLSAIKSRGCQVGLTTRVGVAATHDNPLLLPRLDTNDLPKRTDNMTAS
jgi:peptidoglycan/xylan/chitin deacetylase (PgdA/CDA1 family)